MATCCHHICRVELLNHLYYYRDMLKMNIKEIIFLFKATSWLFSHTDNRNNKKGNNNDKFKDDFDKANKDNDDDSFEKSKNKINNFFEERKIDRKYIGIMAKYIIDIGRCKCLIDKGFNKVLYLKYCSNSITTENNAILAIKN